jgi:hypothetical protein
VGVRGGEMTTWANWICPHGLVVLHAVARQIDCANPNVNTGQQGAFLYRNNFYLDIAIFLTDIDCSENSHIP